MPSAADRARHRRTPHRRGLALAAGRVVGGVLSFALLLGFGYGWYEYRSLNAGMHRFRLAHLGEDPRAGRTGTPQPAGPGRAQNFLLVGIDSRDGLSPAERRLLKVGNDDSNATDTIMILHVPAGGRRATMISIPRDSYVDIPDGWAKNKINAAYGDAYSDAERKGASHLEAERAGADLLVQTVSRFTGLRIDHYVQVGFGGFYTIAKVLGTIPVTLCHAVDDSFARHRATHEPGGSGFKMSAGAHELTPLQALEFVRQRHFLDGGDLAREKRQRYFITAAFDKIASAHVLLDPARLTALIKAVQGAFYFDNGLDPVTFAEQLVDLTANRISGFTIPIRGYQDVTIVNSTQNVVLVDPAQVRQAIQREVNGAPAPPRSTSRAAGSGTPSRAPPASAPASNAVSGCVN